jgi:organic hydroperoxide reductase OsmC/OhrA
MHQYSNKIVWETEKRGKLQSEGKPTLDIATPAEFGGHEGIYSPEDLFVASVNSCFMTTFLTFVEKTRTKFIRFECTAEGTLDKVEKILKFTKIVLIPKVEVPSEREKKHTHHVLDLVEKHCLVSNSMNCIIEMHPEVTIV